MSRLVTTGRAVTLGDGSPAKDYFIRDKETGFEILAERQENGYFQSEIGQTSFTGTVKQTKEHFVSWLETSNDELEVDMGLHDDSLDKNSRGLWDCCHPAAIVIELLAAIPDGQLDGPDGKRLMRIINTTLDNYGYSDEDGKPDYNEARREIDLWVANVSHDTPETTVEDGGGR
jgi:hypothetical protein